MDPEKRGRFVALTQDALNEPDTEKFIGYLLKRDKYIKDLVRGEPEVFGGMMEEYLLRESLILKRLEDERRKVLEKMDVLSKKRKATRSYTSRFPLPPLFSPPEKAR